jgi:hypothetical protein
MAVMSLFAALGCTTVALAEDSTKHRYQGWLENEMLTIKEPEPGASQGWIIVGDDGFEPTEFCGAESDYVCFFSRRFAFAAPKRTAPSVTSWIVHGVQFELENKDLDVSLLGVRKSDLMLIKAPASATAAGRETGKPAYFLYSPIDGLVGFGLDPLPDGAGTTYWLQGTYWFGGTGKE